MICLNNSLRCMKIKFYQILVWYNIHIDVLTEKSYNRHNEEYLHLFAQIYVRL
jgi:hypothetical protein